MSDADLVKFATRPDQRVLSRYAEIALRWTEVFGDRFKIFNFDDLKDDPINFLDSVTTFLGMNLSKRDGDTAKAKTYYGTDGKNGKRSILPDFSPLQRRFVASLSHDDAKAFAEIDKSVSDGWCKKISSIDSGPSIVLDHSSDADSRYQRFLRLTENLGDNCEYGFFQRYEGYEPGSLFRWAISPIDAVIAYIDSPKQLFQKNSLTVKNNSGLVFDSRSGLSFHSKLLENVDGNMSLIAEPRFSDIYEEEVEKIRYLAERFNHFLVSRPGVFVVKSNSGISSSKIDLLREILLKKRADHSVLHVSEGSALEVAKEAEGLYTAELPKFARYVAANKINKVAWKRIMNGLSTRPEFDSILNGMFV